MSEAADKKSRRFSLPKARGSEWANYTVVLVLAMVQLRIGHHILEGKGGNWIALFALFSMLNFQRILALDVLLRPALLSLFWIWAITAGIQLYFI